MTAVRARPPTPIGERPLGVIDILDGSFAALRQRPRVMVAIVVVLIIPSALLEGLLARAYLGEGSFDEVFSDPFGYSNAGNDLSLFSARATIGYLVDWFTIAVAGVPNARVITGWTTGRDTGAGEALRFTARRSSAIVVAFVLIHVIELVATIVFVIPGLLAMIWFSLTSPVIATEDLGGWASMSRSRRLAKPQFGHVLAVVATVGIVGFGVEAAIGTLPSLLTSALGPDRAWPLVSAASFVAKLVVVPITAGAMALTYLDLRFRAEGLDLSLRARDVFAPEVIDA
jgi:hypothetical protein